MSVKETLKQLESEKTKVLMAELYGAEKAEENRARYRYVAERFEKTYGERDIKLFTSPGRTEISGNHTDHNHGKVLAGSINLDCVGAAAPNGTDTIRILSETFHQNFSIHLSDLKPSTGMSGTIDLTKGILKGFEERGYKVGGFDAYITSNVISAAGVSSSASYEMLICSMLNTMFNEGKMDVVTYAHIGKYAENKFWNKASGLLDQMACAVGGLITIDFKNPDAARLSGCPLHGGDLLKRSGAPVFLQPVPLNPQFPPGIRRQPDAVPEKAADRTRLPASPPLRRHDPVGR